jgi:hypothetical protein
MAARAEGEDTPSEPESLEEDEGGGNSASPLSVARESSLAS